MSHSNTQRAWTEDQQPVDVAPARAGLNVGWLIEPEAAVVGQPSPVLALQDQIVRSFSEPAQSTWSSRKTIAFVTGVSALSWVVIGFAAKLILSL
jgi:hypothetical protein